jgi:hypothetical protein
MKDDLQVELRLRGTFIDFHVEPRQTANHRSLSAPPYVQPKFESEDASDDGQLEYLEGLVERASSLQLSMSPTSQGWTCLCGVHSDPDAAFCWNCGKGKETFSLWHSFRRSSMPTFEQPSKAAVSVADDQTSSLPVAWCNLSTTDGGSSQYSRHTSVKDLDNDDSGVSESGVGALDPLTPITTLMISALPVRLTIDQLLASINSAGFLGTYDLVYMPYRSVKKRGKVQHGSPGYAFVNFKTPEFAAQFASVFEGHSFADAGSDRTAIVKQATSQGYHANLALHVREKKQHGSVITFP